MPMMFKCPQCGLTHNDGPAIEPDIYECAKCGRFRLRTDMPVVGATVAPPAAPEPASFDPEELTKLIEDLYGDQTLDLRGVRLIQTLRELQLLRAQDEAGVKLVKGQQKVVETFLEKHALVYMGSGTGGPVDPEAGVGPDGVKRFNLELSLGEMNEFLRPLLLDANMTGRFSGRRAALLSFAGVMADRSRHHAQASLVAPTGDQAKVHQGATAAYEASAKMAKQFAEEGPEEKPQLDS